MAKAWGYLVGFSVDTSSARPIESIRSWDWWIQAIQSARLDCREQWAWAYPFRSMWISVWVYTPVDSYARADIESALKWDYRTTFWRGWRRVLLSSVRIRVWLCPSISLAKSCSRDLQQLLGWVSQLTLSRKSSLNGFQVCMQIPWTLSRMKLNCIILG